MLRPKKPKSVYQHIAILTPFTFCFQADESIFTATFLTLLINSFA